MNDARDPEQFKESFALLKILDISSKNLKQKKYKTVERAFADIRMRITEYERQQERHDGRIQAFPGKKRSQ